jgi:hypothetical protein
MVARNRKAKRADKYDVRVGVNLTVEQAGKLGTMAEECGLTPSALARTIIEVAILRHEQGDE